MEDENKLKTNKANPNIKTLAEDMAEVLEGDKAGLVRKIIHEQELKEQEKLNRSPDSKRNKIFMLSSFFLVAAAVITLFFFVYKKEPNTVPVEAQFNSIIYTDKTAFLEVAGLTPEQISALIRSEVGASVLKDGGVEGLYFTVNKKVVGLREFLALSKSTFSIQDSYFVSDNFLLGAVQTKDGKAPFVLMKMRSISDVFDSIKAFEPKMFAESRSLFGIPLDKDSAYLLTKNFEDAVIQNKNARVLYDNAGKIVMLYVYADDNSVVMTNSPSAVEEIFNRLVASRIKK